MNVAELLSGLTAIDETENTLMKPIELTVPKEISETYQSIYNYFSNKILDFKGKTNLNEEYHLLWSIVNPHKTFIGNKPTVPSMNHQEFKAKLDYFLRFNIKVAGGSLSDLAINKIHNVNNDSKDIDVFIDDTFINTFSWIVGEREYSKETKELHTRDEKLAKYKSLILRDALSLPVYDFSFEHKDELIDYTEPAAVNIDNVFKAVHQDKSIDIIIQKFDRDPGYNPVWGFDFMFRAFSYDGRTIECTDRAYNDIVNKKLTLSNLDSPFSTLLRHLSFQDRYGFKINDTDKDLLLNKAYSSVKNDYKRYEDIFEDKDKLTRTIKNNSNSQSLIKNKVTNSLLDIVNTSNLSNDEFFHHYVRTLFTLFKKFNKSMEADITVFADRLTKIKNNGEARSVFNRLNEIIATSYIGKHRNRLDYILKHKLYKLSSVSFEIIGFPLDSEEIFKLKMEHQRNVVKDNYFNDMEEINAVFNIRKSFGSASGYRSFLDSMDSNIKTIENGICSFREVVYTHYVNKAKLSDEELPGQDLVFLKSHRALHLSSSIIAESESVGISLNVSNKLLTDGTPNLTMTFIDNKITGRAYTVILDYTLSVQNNSVKLELEYSKTGVHRLVVGTRLEYLKDAIYKTLMDSPTSNKIVEHESLSI